MTVEIRIHAKPTGGLSLIDHIPALRPCRLEGRNGIGKSAAIKLLSLAAGNQPYADDAAAWRSLREHLPDDTEITFTGLSSASAATIRLVPSRWPDLPSSDIGDDLGVLVVDGKTRPASELADLVKVHHLAGTERLADTLSGRVAAYRNALAVEQARLEALEPARAALGKLADELEFLAPTQVEADRQANEQRITERDNARSQATDLRKRLATLHKGLALHALLQDIDFQERASELTDAIKGSAEARKLAEELDRVVESAIEKLDAGTKAQRKLAAAERKLNGLLRKRNARLSRLNQLTQQLKPKGIELAGDVPADIDAVADAAQSALDDYRKVERRYRQSLMTDSQRRLHNELLLMLEDAALGGLSDFAIVHLHDLDVTVGELAAALTAPAPQEGIASDEVAEAEQYADRLSDAVSLLREQAEFESNVAEIESTLEELRKETPEQDQLKADLAKAMEQRDAAEEKALRLTQRIGQLQAEGVTEEGAAAARRDLMQILRDETITENELQGRIDEMAARLTELTDLLETAQTEIAAIEERQTRRVVKRRTLELRVANEADLAWLHAPGSEAGSIDINPDLWWQTASDRARKFTDRLDALVAEVAALHYASGSSNRSKYRSTIVTIVEKDAVADFTEPAIREALFDGGMPVAVDLQKGTITWDTTAGVRLEKPLSTFSSGEQALGFIRARLRQLADAPAGDRIVFLDEFGAFLAADRRHPLAELLKGDQLASLSDQVVIVLPLQVDYRAQLDEVTGALKDKYERRAESIDRHGYFTEVFDE